MNILIDQYENLETLVISNDNLTNANEIFEMINQRRILKTILVINANQRITLHTELGKIMKNSLFFVLLVDNDSNRKYQWKRVLTLNNESKVVTNDLDFDKDGRIIEKYNLEALHLISITQSYEPYLKLDHCDTSGRHCFKSYVKQIQN